MRTKLIWLIFKIGLYSCHHESNNYLQTNKKEYYLKDDNVYARHWIHDDTVFYEYFKDVNFDTLVSFALEYEEVYSKKIKLFRADSTIQHEESINTLIGRRITKDYHDNGNLSREIINDSIVWQYFITSIKTFSEYGDTLGDFLVEHTLSKLDDKKIMLTYNVAIDRRWQDSIQVQLWKTMLGGEIIIFESRAKIDTFIFDMSIVEPDIKCGAFNLLHYDNDLKTWAGMPIPFKLEMTN